VSEMPRRPALFAGLVFDEAGNPLEVAVVGDESCYVMQDRDFRRHISSDYVDRQVIGIFREQVLAHRELVTAKMLEMLGRDDLLTKAMVDDALNHMDRVLDYGLPDDARDMLGMMGFRVVVDLHGDIVELRSPGEGMPGEE